MRCGNMQAKRLDEEISVVVWREVVLVAKYPTLPAHVNASVDILIFTSENKNIVITFYTCFSLNMVFSIAVENLNNWIFQM